MSERAEIGVDSVERTRQALQGHSLRQAKLSSGMAITPSTHHTPFGYLGHDASEEQGSSTANAPTPSPTGGSAASPDSDWLILQDGTTEAEVGLAAAIPPMPSPRPGYVPMAPRTPTVAPTPTSGGTVTPTGSSGSTGTTGIQTPSVLAPGVQSSATAMPTGMHGSVRPLILPPSSPLHTSWVSLRSWLR